MCVAWVEVFMHAPPSEEGCPGRVCRGPACGLLPVPHLVIQGIHDTVAPQHFSHPQPVPFSHSEGSKALLAF